jgi:hypothetical protein
MLLLANKDKRYIASKLTCRNVRETLQIVDEIIKIGEKSESLISEFDMEKAIELEDCSQEIKNRKTRLISNVFGIDIADAFQITDDEINMVFSKIHADINSILKKHAQAPTSKDTESTANTTTEHVILSLYGLCVKGYGWSINEIDETDFDTLLDFLYFKEDTDPNVRVIGGQVYKRAEKAPDWL